MGPGVSPAAPPLAGVAVVRRTEDDNAEGFGEDSPVVSGQRQSDPSVPPAVVAQAVKTTTAMPAAAAAAAVAKYSSKNSRALHKLRSELARHLSAIAQVPVGGRYLQEATRVMREMQEVEALSKREAEVSGGSCFRGIVSCSGGVQHRYARPGPGHQHEDCSGRCRACSDACDVWRPSRVATNTVCPQSVDVRSQAEARAGRLGTSQGTISLRQKQSQAEEVQRDKHERLLRALECSGAEEVRLLSARQRGALGRLATRTRNSERRRKEELRGQLVVIKGDVARLWREHNRSCWVGHLSSGGGGEPSSAGDGKMAAPAGARFPSLSGQRHDNGRAGKFDVIAPPVPSRWTGEDGGVGGDGRQARRREAEMTLVDVGPEFPGEQRFSATTPGKKEVNVGTVRSSVSPSSERKNHEKAIIKPSSSASVSKPFANTRRSRGRARWRRKRADAACITIVDGTAAGGALDVLTEEEAQALAALGRGAPRDPRRLLLSSPTLPARHRRQQQPQPEPPPSAHRGGVNVASESRVVAVVDGTTSSGVVASASGLVVDAGRGRHVDCTMPEELEGDDVLDRAAEKLARKIRAEEELLRRRLGLVPSPRRGS